LGCGIIGDKNSIDDLNQMLQEQSPASIRTASLALSAIGDKRALEILASNLLNGSELMRRYAAEALSNNQQEGYPALRDGSSMEDLQVRRSVVFGLIRIDQPWASKIVENLQLEDGEWVVRTAAIQVFDELNNKNNYAPTPLPDLTETPWLADYASRMGTTIAPGKPAEELVIKALNNGTPEEQLFAIDYLRNKCYPRSVDLLYNTYQNNTGEFRDAIYHVLWLMAISGIRLPLLFEKSEEIH
jgi:HEAT repeat protein